MRMVPYWLDTAMPFSDAEAEPVEGRMDVAMIGGGAADPADLPVRHCGRDEGHAGRLPP